MVEFTKEEIIEMWPQARGELTSFAIHLRKTKAGITAMQLEMAIQLAQKEFENLKLR